MTANKNNNVLFVQWIKKIEFGILLNWGSTMLLAEVIQNVVILRYIFYCL